MLEHIFGSKTRLKILNLFFKDPRMKYYVRQLARETDSQLNAIRREIENLVLFGIIKTANVVPHENAAKDNEVLSEKIPQESLRKYYEVNTDFVLYHELRALLLKSRILIEKDFIKKIETVSQVSLLILTGVFVGREDAPTDLLMVGMVDKKRLRPIIDKFEKILQHNIRYTIMNLAEYKYRKEVTDKFLYDILENKKVVIIDKSSENEKGVLS